MQFILLESADRCRLPLLLIALPSKSGEKLHDWFISQLLFRTTWPLTALCLVHMRHFVATGSTSIHWNSVRAISGYILLIWVYIRVSTESRWTGLILFYSNSYSAPIMSKYQIQTDGSRRFETGYSDGTYFNRPVFSVRISPSSLVRLKPEKSYSEVKGQNRDLNLVTISVLNPEVCGLHV